MEMICKGCSKELSQDECRIVGQWPFCPGCFDDLMNAATEPEVIPEEADEVEEASKVESLQDMLAGVKGAKKRHGQGKRCHTCHREIEGDNYRKLGAWFLCNHCMGNIAPTKPAEEEAEPVLEGAPSSVPASVSGTGRSFAPKKLSFTVQTPGENRTKQCAGCGKKLPEGGYREVGGAPFCPDCYYKMETIEVSTTLTTGLAPAPEAPGGEKTLCCDSCGREGPEDAFQEAEGFRLCRPCLSSDAESALMIAREKHRQKLRELRDQLS